MSDFDFDDLAVKADNLAEIRLPQLARHGHVPVLTVALAAEENPPYWNALARREKARQRERRGAQAVTTDVVKQLRDDDSILFSKHVVKGWKGVVDKAGALAPFSPDECLKWLRAVAAAAPEVWLEISAFCQDRNNFRSNTIDTEEAAKNS